MTHPQGTLILRSSILYGTRNKQQLCFKQLGLKKSWLKLFRLHLLRPFKKFWLQQLRRPRLKLF